MEGEGEGLRRHWLDCTAGIILITPDRPFPEDIPKMTLLNEEASCKVLFLLGDRYDGDMSNLYEFQEFFDCLHVPLRITENSTAPLIGDFLRQFETVRCLKDCSFDCVLRFHDGKAQFYITSLRLQCDDHAKLFSETITISTPSRLRKFVFKTIMFEILKMSSLFFPCERSELQSSWCSYQKL